MRAEGTDREQFVAATGKEYRLVADVPEQHGAIRDCRKFDALNEIWSVTLRLFFAHSDLSEVAPTGAFQQGRPEPAGPEVCRCRLLIRDPFDAVIGEEAFVIRPIDRDRLVVRRAILHLLTIDIELNQPPRPIDLLYQTR